MAKFKCANCGSKDYFNASGGFTYRGQFLDYDARGRYRFCAVCGTPEGADDSPSPKNGLDPDYIAKLHSRLDEGETE